MFHKAFCALNHIRMSRTLVLFVGCLAMFLDTILNSIVEPILPDYLYRVEHQNSTGPLSTSYPTYEPPVPGDAQSSESSCNDWATCLPAVDTEQELSGNSMGAKELKKENVKLWIIYASPSAASIIANPIAGLLADRFGFSVILYIGVALIFLETIAYYFIKSYAALIALRVVQGFGSSFAIIAAYIMLALTFTHNTGRAGTIALIQSGLTVGSLVGPAVGEVVYQYLRNKFLLLLILVVGLAVVVVVFRLLLPMTSEAEYGGREKEEGISIFDYLRDRYIIIAAVFAFIQSVTAVMVWGTVPVWMMISMKASPVQLGVAIVPTAVGFIIGAVLSSKLFERARCWLLTLVGIAGLGVFTTIIPVCKNIPQLAAPYLFFGLASGLVETSVVTEILRLADVRLGSRYGRAFAISETAIAIGIFIGIMVGGVLLAAVGFLPMMLGLGIVNILLSPAAILLRNPSIASTEKRDKLAIVYKEVQNQLQTWDYKPQPGEGS